MHCVSGLETWGRAGSTIREGIAVAHSGCIRVTRPGPRPRGHRRFCISTIDPGRGANKGAPSLRLSSDQMSTPNRFAIQ